MTPRPRGKPPRPKTISASGVTGQKGVNAIERVVLDMGSRWTPSGPNEIGIDGYIELFDPNSKQSLGLTLAVQSKVVSAIAADSSEAIEYWCDPDDLTYWLNGNTPVVLVVSDGTPERSYWISITHYFKNWDRTKPTSVTFDKSAHRFNRDSFSQLAEIAAPKPGLYLAPSIRTETLHTNLLPVEAFPPTISSPGQTAEAIAMFGDSSGVLAVKLMLRGCCGRRNYSRFTIFPGRRGRPSVTLGRSRSFPRKSGPSRTNRRGNGYLFNFSTKL